MAKNIDFGLDLNVVTDVTCHGCEKTLGVSDGFKLTIKKGATIISKRMDTVTREVDVYDTGEYEQYECDVLIIKIKCDSCGSTTTHIEDNPGIKIKK